MEPIIPSGSLIYTVKVKEYFKGDIVTFVTDKGNIAHRIVKLVNLGGINYFSTKGDANIDSDMDLVPENVIYGKIVTIIPFLGGVVSFFKSTIGFVIGALFAFSIFILSFIPKKPAQYDSS